MQEYDHIVHLGTTNGRTRPRLFGVRRNDRRHHMYVVGQTGTGKTTLLELLIRQDIAAGEGLILFDPHGDLAGKIVAGVPDSRRDDLISFDPADPACPYRFNPLGAVSPERRTIAVAAILEAFEKLWSKTWGPRMEHILRNVLLTLLEQPATTLADIPRILGNDAFRREAVSLVSNPEVRRFWIEEFGCWTPRLRVDAAGPILNKVGAFLADPLVRRVVADPGEVLDMRAVMDQGKILIVNLSKGRIGGTNAELLGALILSRIELAALERIDTPEESRRDIAVYLDEFQNYMSLSLASMLSELRKMRVSMVLAHQYVGQLSEEVRTAILGNVGTVIAFRVGLEDGRHLEPLFSPVFNRHDLVSLPNQQIYIRLMVDGRVSRPFSAETILPGDLAVAA